MGASPTKEARHNLQDEAGSLNNLTSMAMKQIDIFRGQEFIKVTTANGLDKDVQSAVSDFFTAATEENDGKTKAAKRSAISGAKKMVLGALNSFLGASQAGETMAHEFFVIFLHNAFVRVDCYLWKRSVSAKALGAEASQDIIGYLCALAVIPMADLEPDEIDFLLSEALAADGQGEDFAIVQELAVNLKILKTLTTKLGEKDHSVKELKELITTITDLNRHVKEKYGELENMNVDE